MNDIINDIINALSFILSMMFSQASRRASFGSEQRKYRRLLCSWHLPRRRSGANLLAMGSGRRYGPKAGLPKNWTVLTSTPGRQHSCSGALGRTAA